MRNPIHKFDYDRLQTKAHPLPDFKPGEANTEEIQQGLNIYWCDENPALFGQSVQRLLMQCPPDKWDVKIQPGIYPGETWSIIAKRKD